MNNEDLSKVWLLRDDKSGFIRGGICVGRNGLILTTCIDLNLDAENECWGSAYGLGEKEWKLRLIKGKKNEGFDLALFKVYAKDGVNWVESQGPFPWVELGGGKELVLNRGEEVVGVVHEGRVPWSSKFGRVCREFDAARLIRFPDYDDGETVITRCEKEGLTALDAYCDLERVFAEPFAPLCVGLIVTDDDDGVEVVNSSDEDGSDEDIDDDEPESDDYGDYIDDEDDEGKRSVFEYWGNDSDNDGFVGGGGDEPRMETEIKPWRKMNHLHPYVPLVEVSGLGRGRESLGAAVFREGHGLLGLYSFYKTDYEYIIPRNFLEYFMSC